MGSWDRAPLLTAWAMAGVLAGGLARGAEGPAVLEAARRVAASGWDVRAAAGAAPREGAATSIASLAPLQARLEDDVGDLILAWLGEHPRAGAAALRDGVLDAVASMGAPQEPWDLDGMPTGSLADIEVARPVGHRRLLVAVARFHGSCGEDAAAYVLDASPAAPRLLARIGGDQLAGSRETRFASALTVAVSTPDASGAFFVAAAVVSPPCHSHWQELRLAVLRPGWDPGSPRVLHAAAISVFHHSESGIDLAIDGATAVLGCEVAQSLDAGRLTRHERRRLHVDGDAVTALLPASMDPRGFVDEWLQAPWDVASAMTTPGMRDVLAPRHAHGPGAGAYTELGALLASPDGDAWAVEVMAWPGSPSPDGSTDSRSVWFVVGERNGTWIMEDAGEAPPAAW